MQKKETKLAVAQKIIMPKYTYVPDGDDGDVNGDIEALEYEESEIKDDGLGNAYIDLDGNNIYLGKIGEYMKSYGGAWTRITLNN